VLDGRPAIYCFASYPLTPWLFTAPALVDLEMAAYLKRRGWWIIGPDPHSEQLLADWLKTREWTRRVDPAANEDDGA
jgi:hypothetical protein